MAFYMQAKALTALFLVLFGCLALTLMSSHGGDQIGNSGSRRLMEDELAVGSDKVTIKKLCVVKHCGSYFNSNCKKFCCATMADEPCWPTQDECFQHCP
ncbi:unnamed protein product [Alopecurus aequalis]